MIITHYGGEFFKIQFGEATLALNPVSKDSKLKSSRFGADIALVSLDNPDFNGVDQIGFGEKMPFIISGPGEYEIKEITAAGFASGSKYGGEPRTNTIYSIHFDDLSLMYLGALGDLDVPPEVLEMDSPDILIIPVGGAGALSPTEAQKLAVKLEAKIIIPIETT